MIVTGRGEALGLSSKYTTPEGGRHAHATKGCSYRLAQLHVPRTAGNYSALWIM